MFALFPACVLSSWKRPHTRNACGGNRLVHTAVRTCVCPQVVHGLLVDPAREVQHAAQRLSGRLVSGTVEGREDALAVTAAAAGPPKAPAVEEGGGAASAAVPPPAPQPAPVPVPAPPTADEELAAFRKQWQARFLGTGGLLHLLGVVVDEGVLLPGVARGGDACLPIHRHAAALLLTVFRHFMTVRGAACPTPRAPCGPASAHTHAHARTRVFPTTTTTTTTTTASLVLC